MFLENIFYTRHQKTIKKDSKVNGWLKEMIKLIYVADAT